MQEGSSQRINQQNIPNIKMVSQNQFFKILNQKVDNLHQLLNNIKATSAARKNARKQKLINFNKQQKQRQIEHQQKLKQITNMPPASHFKQQSLNGLVVQVPQNQQLHSPETNPYSLSNSTYYVSQVLKNYKDPKSVARQHIQTSIQILKTLQKSKLQNKQEIQNKLLNFPVKPGCQGLKTIVFDLDQTLIHCNQSVSVPHDIKITIKFPTGESCEAGVNIRPGAIELLHRLKGKFQVMIFTASHSCYADQILNYLDPKKELIHHRMYRQHCHISNEGYFVKDLRIIGRQMKNLLLVDNAAYSYAYQLDNGVPILPYFQGKNDFQLKALGDYLLSMVNEKELRSINRKVFKLNRYTQFQNKAQRLVEELYTN